MDTSQTYIEMCKALTEIQNTDRLLYPGDILGFVHTPEWHVKYSTRVLGYDMGKPGWPLQYAINNFRWSKFAVVWLPRQDQLQFMLTGIHKDIIDLIHSFTNFAVYWRQPTSTMEQLWLGLTAKELYNKWWSNNDWQLIITAN